MVNKGKRTKKSTYNIKLFIIIFIILFPIVYLYFSYRVDINSKNEEINRLKEELNLKQEEINQKTEELDVRLEEIDNANYKINELEKKNTVSSRSSVTSRKTSTEDNNEYIKFTATAYCPCSNCCGKSDGITARGTKATANYTVAMSSKYSFGTKIEIQGMGTYVVEDRGGAINDNRIDIYFDTHQEALNFGRRTVYLKVID